MIFDKNNFSKILPPIMKFTLVLKYLLKALSRIQFWSCSLRKKSATGLWFPRAKVNPSWHEIVIECVTFPWKEDVKNYKRTHICTLLVATGFEISVKCNWNESISWYEHILRWYEHTYIAIGCLNCHYLCVK